MYMNALPPVIDIRNLTVPLPLGGDRRNAVEDVSFSASQGEIVCVVGESGSGKSVTAQTIMGLMPKTFARPSGAILSLIHI